MEKIIDKIDRVIEQYRKRNVIEVALNDIIREVLDLHGVAEVIYKNINRNTITAITERLDHHGWLRVQTLRSKPVVYRFGELRVSELNGAAHGHVIPNGKAASKKCGGVGKCMQCNAELLSIKQSLDAVMPPFSNIDSIAKWHALMLSPLGGMPVGFHARERQAHHAIAMLLQHIHPRSEPSVDKPVRPC